MIPRCWTETAWQSIRVGEVCVLPSGVSREALARIVTGPDRISVVIVNASQSDFENHSFNLSSRIADDLESWVGSEQFTILDTSANEDVVRNALAREEASLARSRSRRLPSRVREDDEEERACCWVTIVELHRTDGVSALWASGDEVAVVRSGSMVAHTDGHVLNFDSVRGPVGRGFGGPYREDEASFQVQRLASEIQPMDRVFVASTGLLSAAGIGDLVVGEGYRDEDALRELVVRSHAGGRVPRFGVGFVLELIADLPG